MLNTMNQSQEFLPQIESFEEYETFKTNIDALEAAAMKILLKHNLPRLTLRLFSEGTNIVFEYGENQVIKIFPPFHSGQYHSEWLLLKHLDKKLSVNTPKLQYHGEYAGWPYIIMTKLDGTLLETLWADMDYDNKIIIIGELGTLKTIN